MIAIGIKTPTINPITCLSMELYFVHRTVDDIINYGNIYKWNKILTCEIV